MRVQAKGVRRGAWGVCVLEALILVKWMMMMTVTNRFSEICCKKIDLTT